MRALRRRPPPPSTPRVGPRLDRASGPGRAPGPSGSGVCRPWALTRRARPVACLLPTSPRETGPTGRTSTVLNLDQTVSQAEVDLRLATTEARSDLARDHAISAAATDRLLRAQARYAALSEIDLTAVEYGEDEARTAARAIAFAPQRDTDAEDGASIIEALADRYAREAAHEALKALG